VTYRFIAQFPEDAAAYGSAELQALGRVWLERRVALKESDAFRDFLKKLQREWAIETGIIVEKGKYKTLPNNPRRRDGTMHTYCPPELTQDEMQRLIDWYRDHDAGLPPEVKAAWLHHRFTQIHPFQDGNGRVARALASLVFLKEGFFPLVIRDADRQEYIPALEAADAGDLRPLVGLFARRQKEAILHALGLEQQVQQSRQAEAIIASALHVLKGKYDAAQRQVGLVYDCADALFAIDESRMQEIAGDLDRQLAALTPPQQSPYRAQLHSAGKEGGNRHYFYKQIVDIAHLHHYFANLDRYRAWVRICIATDDRFEIVVSLHGYGHGDTGVMAASAFTNRRVEREDGGNEYVDLRPAGVDLFQFNYAEPRESTVERFKDWLEGSLAIALAEWQRLIAA
jgi:hypothetical protein